VALEITDDSKEHIASIIKVEINSEIGTTLALTSKLFYKANFVAASLIFYTFMIEVIRSPKRRPHFFTSQKLHSVFS
jgi:hypothetical protein